MAIHADFLPQFLEGWVGTGLTSLWHGVDVFFIISGFLIPASLKRHGDIRKFYFDRLLRIMPLYVSLHILIFAVGPLIGYKFFYTIGFSDYLKIFVANLMLVAPILNFPLAQQNSWTLTYEWGFYLLTGILFYFSARRPNRLMILISLMLACFSFYYFPKTLYFGIGLLFAQARFRFKFPNKFGLLISLISVVFFYFGSEFISPYFGVVPSAILFASVLDRGSYLARFLDAPEPQFLGKISYSLYLIHPFALFPFQIIFEHLAASGWNKSILFFLFVVFGTLTSLTIANFSYRFIEVGLRKRVERSFKQVVNLM